MLEVKEYTAVMVCVDDEYVGMNEVRLYDDEGELKFVSCQIVADDLTDYARIFEDMNDWCLEHRAPQLSRCGHRLWYEVKN